MSALHRAAAILHIRPGEGPVAARVLALMVVAWGGAAVGSSAVESLFFARFGVTNLPIMYIALGLVTFPVTLGVSALLARPDRGRILAAIPLALAGVTCVLRLLLAVDARWVYPVLWLSMMIAWIVLALDTWGLAGITLDSRQAKRLFPLYGAGVILGGALGGLLTPALATRLHVENLLLVWGLSLVAAWALARSVPGRSGRRLRTRSRHAATGLLEGAREGARYVGRSRLLRRMSLAILLSTALYFSLARVFAGTVTARFPAPDDLAGFLGLFSAATNLGALVLSLLVTNWLLTRIGVAAGLVIMPVVYAAGFAWLAWAGPAFAPVVGFRLVQWTWMYGVWSIGWQALWNVVPPERRQQARAFVDGGPMQWGVLLAGVALLLSQRRLTDRQFFALAAVVAVGAVVAAWAVKRAYHGALVDALRAGWPEVFVDEDEPFGGVIADPAARKALSDAMDDSDPGVRRVAAEILSTMPDSGPAARRGLGDPDPGVRAAALRAVARSGAEADRAASTPLLRDPDAAVRAAAAVAVGAGATTDEPGLVAALRPLLSDPDPEVRVRAAQGLVRAWADNAQALRTLTELGSSSDPEERALAIAALGELAVEPETVVAALRDPQPPPRRAAARGLPAFGADLAMGPLLEALADDDPTVRDAVAEALISLGPDAADRVGPLLEDPRREATALAVLVHLPDADRDVLRAYAQSEQRRALRYHGLWRAVSPMDDERVVLLTSALRHRALRHAEHAVHALAPSGDHDAIDIAIQNVTSRDATERAYALETIEASSDADLVRPLLAVWEPVPSSRRAAAAQARSMLDDDDPWIRACAAFASGTFPDGDLRTLVSRLARHDADPEVRRAAADAVREDGAMETVSTLSLMDRMVALQRAPLFRVMSPEDLKHVAESLTERVFVDGAVIASEGEPGDIMHVVVSGDVRVLRGGEHPMELARRGPGYIVGELAILADQPRMADLMAVGDVRTVSIDRTRFMRILRERPDAALAVMRELSIRLVEAGAAGSI